jgi:hypothetical protein
MGEITIIDCSNEPITVDNFMRSCFLYGINPEMAVDMAASMFTREAMEQYMLKVAERIEVTE